MFHLHKRMLYALFFTSRLIRPKGKFISQNMFQMLNRWMLDAQCSMPMWRNPSKTIAYSQFCFCNKPKWQSAIARNTEYGIRNLWLLQTIVIFDAWTFYQFNVIKWTKAYSIDNLWVTATTPIIIWEIYGIWKRYNNSYSDFS